MRKSAYCWHLSPLILVIETPAQLLGMGCGLIFEDFTFRPFMSYANECLTHILLEKTYGSCHTDVYRVQSNNVGSGGGRQPWLQLKCYQLYRGMIT